jgi:hypothetical protein
MTLAKSQLALAPASMCAGERESVEILRRLLRRMGPTLVRRIDEVGYASNLPRGHEGFGH